MIRLSPPLKTTLIYAVFGLVWILFSDHVLEWLISDPHLLTHFQSLKGAAYVLLTSVLLYVLMRRDYARIVAQEAETRRIFTSTMRAVQHILNNFLQSMYLFKHEAEQSAGVRPEVLDLFDQVIVQASDEIAELSALEKPSEEEIARTVYQRSGEG